MSEVQLRKKKRSKAKKDKARSPSQPQEPSSSQQKTNPPEPTTKANDNILTQESQNKTKSDLLLSICKILELDPTSTDPKHLIDIIGNSLPEKLKNLPKGIEKPLLEQSSYTPQQYEELEEINTLFSHEYFLRKKLLLQRMQVTLQSMLYSDKCDSNREQLEKESHDKLDNLTANSKIDISPFFAFTTNSSVFKNSASVMTGEEVKRHTKAAIKNVIIGQMPDRGGRPTEDKPENVEEASFSKRDSGKIGFQSGYQQNQQFNRNQNQTHRLTNQYQQQQQQQYRQYNTNQRQVYISSQHHQQQRQGSGSGWQHQHPNANNRRYSSGQYGQYGNY